MNKKRKIKRKKKKKKKKKKKPLNHLMKNQLKLIVNLKEILMLLII